MGNKITIIGAGSVGSTIAYAASVKGLASEIVFIDINQEKALGEAMDIYQGTSYSSPAKIYAGAYEDAKDSDVVIFTSGLARKPGQTRLDLAQANVNITKSVIPQITKAAPNAIYIIVANPVDILTYQFIKTSGIPENRIIGSGTILDTARLRTRLAEIYDVNPENVHAHVFGEHGDSSFVPWSLANIASVPADVYAKASSSAETLNHEEIEDFVRKSGGIVIKRKGATFHAVAISVCNLVECILNKRSTVVSVSTMMNGEYGLNDVCLSTLVVIGRNGVEKKIAAPLTDAELAALKNSADSLKAVLSQIQF